MKCICKNKLTDDFILGFLTGLGTRFVGDRLEELYQWTKRKVKDTKNDVGKITILKYPHEMIIEKWYELSSTYKGNGKSAFFSCRIQDSQGNYCWYGDYEKSIERGFNYKGEYIEKGMLNMENDSYSSTWNIKADSNLKSGNGNLTVGVFEMKDSVDADGHTKQFRPHITLEDREIVIA